MNHAAAVAARIEAQVPAIAGRVESASRLAELTEANKAPQRTPALFVLFSDIVGGTADYMPGRFTQHYNEQIKLVLFERGADDWRGSKAAAKLSTLVTDILEAVLGWSPGGPLGAVLTLGRAGFVGFVGSASVYEIDLQLAERLENS